jgi:TonB family protein
MTTRPSIPKPPAEDFLDRWSVPAALTLAIYSALSGGLYGVNEYYGDEGNRPAPVVEMDFYEPPPPQPVKLEPEPEPPQPEPEPEPDPAPKIAKIAEVTREPITEPRAAPTDTPPVLDEPAPGDNVNDDDLAPRRVYRLPDQGAGGTIPVARGRTTGSSRGVEGGTGTNTGGGGDAESKGTGVAKTVSITALKRKPIPKGGQDFSKLKQPIDEEVVIKVRVLVDATGKVAQATLVKKSGRDLDDIALELARDLLFEPALGQDDEPVATQIVWTFRFTPG